MKTLECNIKHLHWLHVREEERYHRAKDRNVFSEAHQRGEQILNKILNLFPDLKPLKTLEQMQVIAPQTGDFEFRIALDFYSSQDTGLTVVKYNSISNFNFSDALTDICLLINAPTTSICEQHQEKIQRISDSYKKPDSIEENHSLTFKIIE